MFEGVTQFFKRIFKIGDEKGDNSKNAAKERLHLVLMQDRANVSADFLELMKQEIIEVIKKYIVVDEDAIDVRLTNQSNEDGTNGAPALYANIPILNIKNDMKAEKMKEEKVQVEDNQEEEVIEQIEEAKEIIEKNEEIINEEKADNNIEDKEEQEENKDQENNDVEDVQEEVKEENLEENKEEVKEEKIQVDNK